MKCGKIYVKNTEKPTFLILKDDDILRTAISELESNESNQTSIFTCTEPNVSIKYM